MNATGLRRITDEYFLSACGQYAVVPSGIPLPGAGRAWSVIRESRVVARVRNLRAAGRMIDDDATRRATEILTLGVEVPY